jgi:hypothetical protein
LKKMKFSSRPQYYRLRRIVEMIREGMRAGKYPNATAFRRELEVSRRTVMRDLDFLRDEENAPIEYLASEHGYKLMPPRGKPAGGKTCGAGPQGNPLSCLFLESIAWVG